MVTTTTQQRKPRSKRRDQTKRPVKPTVQSGLVELLPDASSEDDSQLAVAIEIDLLDNQLTGPTDPDCRWRTQEEIDAAVATARQEGGLQNINVTPLEGGRFSIEQGRHRTLASKLAGCKKMFAVIRRDWNRKKATIAAVAENESRTADSPYHAGKQYHQAIEAGNKLTDIVSRTRWSEATIRHRLAIFKLGPELGPVFAERLGQEDLPYVKPFADDETLASSLAQHIATSESHGHWLIKTWVDGAPNLCMPLRDEFVREVLGDNDWQASSDILRDEVFEQAIHALPGIQAGPKDNRVLVCLDVEGATEAVQAAQEQRKKRLRKNAKEHQRTGRDPEQLRRERIQKRCRTTGLGYLVKHLNSRPSFGDDLHKHALRRLLTEAGQVASAKIEQQALAELLGEYAPKDPSQLVRGCPDLVDALWDKDRVVLDRYVAAVVFLRSRDSSYGGTVHLVKDAELSQFATGKTAKQLESIARRAVDAELKANASKGKNASKGGTTGRRSKDKAAGKGKPKAPDAATPDSGTDTEPAEVPPEPVHSDGHADEPEASDEAADDPPNPDEPGLSEDGEALSDEVPAEAEAETAHPDPPTPPTEGDVPSDPVPVEAEAESIDPAATSTADTDRASEQVADETGAEAPKQDVDMAAA